MKHLILLCLLIVQSAYAQEAYQNPVDGKVYVSNWKTYKPASNNAETVSRVKNSGVRLLSLEEEFEKNTSATELARIIGYAQESLEYASKGRPESGEILLQVTLSKEELPELKFSFRGNLTEKVLQSFKDRCSEINLKTKVSSVSFQVHFVVAGA